MAHPDRLVPINALEATDRMGAAQAQIGGGKRVSKADVEQEIGQIFYVLGDNAARVGMGEVLDGLQFDYNVLACTVICIITMKNGFIVIGHSTPLDPRNYDFIVARTNAYENAFRQLWPLLAFRELPR